MSRLKCPAFVPRPWGRTIRPSAPTAGAPGTPLDHLVFRSAKEQGEWAELCFALRAVSQGLGFAKPWGEHPFDSIVINGSRLSRVQVKSTFHRLGRGYQCQITARYYGTKRPYGPEDTDFIAAYIIPENACYILPVQLAATLGDSIFLKPHCQDNKYRPYLEAWHLFGPPVHGQRPQPGSLVVPIVMRELLAPRIASLAQPGR